MTLSYMLFVSMPFPFTHGGCVYHPMMPVRVSLEYHEKYYPVLLVRDADVLRMTRFMRLPTARKFPYRHCVGVTVALHSRKK